MIRTALALLLLCLALPAKAAGDGKDYLSDQPTFAAAWDRLGAGIGAGAELFSVDIAPDRITVLVRAGPGQPWLNRWQVTPANLANRLLGRAHSVAGPAKAQASGPGTIVDQGFFAAADLPVDRFVAILDEAAGRVVMRQPGRVVGVSIKRRIAFGASLGYGDVRWAVEIAGGRERATATMALDGGFIGLDISRTERGMTKDFLAQDDWPFDAAEDGFRALVGDGATVYRIEVRAKTILVAAALPDDPDKVIRYRWDGGRFTKDFTAMPRIFAAGPRNRNLPFRLDEAGLPRLPAILEAARAEMDGKDVRLHSVEALKQDPVTGPAETLWIVRFADTAAGGRVADKDTTEVRVRGDGTVLAARPPASARPQVRYTSALGVLAAIEEFTATFGGAARVHGITLYADKVRLQMDSDKTPGMVAEIGLRHSGLSRDRESRPMPMVHSEAGLFALDALKELDAATVATIMGQAVGLVGDRNGEVLRVTIWSGAPFFRSPDGGPVIEVRVGLLPAGHELGRAVFTLSGEFVDLVK